MRKNIPILRDHDLDKLPIGFLEIDEEYLEIMNEACLIASYVPRSEDDHTNGRKIDVLYFHPYPIKK